MDASTENDRRIEDLIAILGRIAAEDFSARFTLSAGIDDHIEALGIGVSMLGKRSRRR